MCRPRCSDACVYLGWLAECFKLVKLSPRHFDRSNVKQEGDGMRSKKKKSLVQNSTLRPRMQQVDADDTIVCYTLMCYFSVSPE